MTETNAHWTDWLWLIPLMPILIPAFLIGWPFGYAIGWSVRKFEHPSK